MKFLRNENGQTLVLTALCMTAMLGFMALALDVGLLFRARRNMQTAADSAAIAGAQDYMWNASTTTARTQAKNASTANGYTDGASGAVVTVNIPPTSGPNTGSAGFIEAIVSQPVSTVFMGMFSRSSVNVGARSGCYTLWRHGLHLADGAFRSCARPSGKIHHQCSQLRDIRQFQYRRRDERYRQRRDCQCHVSQRRRKFQSQTHYEADAPTMNAGTRKDPWGNLQGPDPATACTAANTVTVSPVTAANLKSPVNGVVCFSATNATLSAGLALPGGVVYVAENGVTIGGDMTIGTTSNGATLDVYAGTLTRRIRC